MRLRTAHHVSMSAYRPRLAAVEIRAYGAQTDHPGKLMLRPAQDSVTRADQTVAVSRPRGFTLVELLITIAVAAIIVALAIPSFTSIINNNRLTSAANEMVGILQAARMEGVRQNRSMTVCRSANSQTCAAGGAAWIVIDPDDKVLRISGFHPQVTPSADIDEFVFRADGLAREDAASGLLNTNFGFCIDTTSPAENSRTVSIGSGSRISTAAPAAKTCP